MAGDEGHGLVHLAVGDWDAGAGQSADPGGDAGDDADRDAVADQGLRLLAAAAEDEGVAPLQPQHPTARAGQVDQPQRDVALQGRGLAAALAGEDALGSRSGPVQQRRVHQRVVDDDIGLPQRVQPVQRHQPRIARPRAAEPDPAGQQFGPVAAGKNGRFGHSALMPQRSPDQKPPRTGRPAAAARGPGGEGPGAAAGFLARGGGL